MEKSGGMTVGQLRQRLAELDDDLPVLVAAQGEYEGTPEVIVDAHLDGRQVCWLEI